MTPAEYVEGLNALVATGRSDLEASVVAYGQIAEPTLDESVAFIEREIAIRSEFLEGFEALDPPIRSPTCTVCSAMCWCGC